MKTSLKSTNCNDRRGGAALEFAFVLPLIVVMLAGSVEIGRGVMMQHALEEASASWLSGRCI